MVYRRNFYVWEQILCLIITVTSSAAALFWSSNLSLVYALIGGGSVAAVSGVFGISPDRAMVSRKIDRSAKAQTSAQRVQ